MLTDSYDKDEQEYDYNEYDSDNINSREKNMQKDENDQKFHSYQNQGTKQSGSRRNQGSKNYSRNIGSPLESIEPVKIIDFIINEISSLIIQNLVFVKGYPIITVDKKLIKNIATPINIYK